MAVDQPVSGDTLAEGNHDESHRIIATDPSAPVKTVTVDSSGNTKIGTDGSNFTEIEADGTVEFHGDATVWDDLRVSANTVSFLGLGSYPDWETFTYDLQGLAFSSSADEEVHFSVQMPHGWKEGSTIYPHVHWAPSTAASGGVTWVLEYTWANINGTFGSSSTMTFDDSTDSTALKHHIAVNGTGIDGSGKTLSSMLICRLYRDVSDANDDYGADAFLLEFDIHYELDTVGSRQETSK